MDYVSLSPCLLKVASTAGVIRSSANCLTLLPSSFAATPRRLPRARLMPIGSRCESVWGLVLLGFIGVLSKS